MYQRSHFRLYVREIFAITCTKCQASCYYRVTSATINPDTTVCAGDIAARIYQPGYSGSTVDALKDYFLTLPQLTLKFYLNLSSRSTFLFTGP